MFQVSFKNVSRKFQECFMEVLRKVQENVKVLNRRSKLRVFQGCSVFESFFACHSSQLPKQKEGLFSS